MTNYRKIKPMSIDKMAEFLLDFELCKVCPCSDEDGYCTYEPFDCEKVARDWLKQKVRKSK